MKENSILAAMKQFINDFGGKPGRMVADRDFKLIGGAVANYLTTPTLENNTVKTTQVMGAPDGRQNQNGLIESHWKKIMTLARSWLTSNLLPTKFWYFAIRQAVQVHNYTPIKVDGIDTTPHEVLYGQKPDYRNLFPMFSLANVKRRKDGKKHRGKIMSQTIQAICVGNDDKSDGRLFYIPHSKGLVGSADYVLDPVPPSGPLCNIEYDGGIHFNLYSEDQDIMHPPRLQGQRHCLVSPHQSLRYSQRCNLSR